MKEHLAIFLSLLVGIFAHHEVHLVPAHIICPDVSPDHDILLPDPHDCSVYYRCENGTAVPQSCPPGLAWCQILQNCTLPILANCTLSHTVVTYSPEELVTYNPNPTTTTGNPGPTGPTTHEETCPEDDVVVPDTGDCSKYYKCEDGHPKSQDCSKGDFFDTWLGICNAPDLSNCINVGSQNNKTCPVNGEKRVYADDCSKYYECAENKVVTKQCASGMKFNQWFNDCYSSDLAYCHTYTTVTPTTSSTTIKTPVEGSNLCPASGFKLPNPLDCHTFYVCTGDTPELQDCPDGMYYSCWDQECLPPTVGQCLPTEGQTCTNPGEKLANAQNCNSYYECNGNVTVTIECDHDLEYNPWFKECVKPSLAHCTVTKTTTPTSTTSHTTTISPGSPICPADNATLPNLFDCHSYFICKNDIPVPEECPNGMEYSCWDQECLPEEAATCVDQITSNDNCGKINNTMPNKEDCSSYYECINGKVESKKCNEGLEFSAWYGFCVDSSLSHCQLHLSTTTPNSTPTVTVTVTQNTTQTKTTPAPNLPTTNGETCPEDDVVVPDTGDCSKYHKCKDGHPMSQDCPKGDFFDTWLGICIAPDISNCINIGSQNNKTCPVNGEKRVYPGDCSKYYECAENKVVTKQCASGMEFNQWFNDCYSSDLAYCHTYTTVTPTTSSTTIKTPVEGENLCPASGFKLPNPLDCHTFYVCTGDTPELQDCPDGMYYSCWDQECLPPTVGQCLPTDGQTCTKPGEKLANAQNCNSYYECNDNVTVTIECDHDLEYNPWFQECVKPSLAHCTVTKTTTPTSTTSHTTTISPESPICPADNAKLPNLFDCHSYFICKNDIPVQEECPNGMEYSCWDQECLPGEAATCIDQITSNDNCGKMNNTMPSKEDCSSYYECINGKVESKKCDEGLEFSAWYGFCVNSSLSHCQLHLSTTTPNSTPTVIVTQNTTQTKTTLSITTPSPSPPSPLCPVAGLIYPSYIYCNAYMKCDDNRQLKTIECVPPQFHYNCETKTCENITHCCSPTNSTLPPGSTTPTGPLSSDTTTPPGTSSPGSTTPPGPLSSDTTTPPGTSSPGSTTPTGPLSSDTTTPPDTSSPGSTTPPGPLSSDTTTSPGTSSPGSTTPTGPLSSDTTTPPDTSSPGSTTPPGPLSSDTTTPPGTSSPGSTTPTGPVSSDTTTPPGTSSPGSTTPTGPLSSDTTTPPGTSSPGSTTPTGPLSSDTTTPPDTSSPGSTTPPGPLSSDTTTPPGTSSPGSTTPTGPLSSDTTTPPGTSSPGSTTPTGPLSSDTTTPPGTSSPGSTTPTGPLSSDTTTPPGTSSPGSTTPTGPLSSDTTTPPGTSSPGSTTPTGPLSSDTTTPPGTSSPGSTTPTGPLSSDTTTPPGTSSPGSTTLTGPLSSDTTTPPGTSSPGSTTPTGPVSSDTTTPPGTSSPGSTTPTGPLSSDTTTPPGTSSPGTTTPTGPPSPLCSEAGLMYPSYKYCNAYMKCDDNRQLKTIECVPPQFHYNCETKKCENIAHCCSPGGNDTMTPGPTTPTDTPSPVTTTSTPTTTIEIPSTPGVDVCPFEGAKLPNPVDCKSYYICRNNTPVSESCPSEQVYSCWDQTCQAPKDATCIKNVEDGQSCSGNDQQPNIGDCSSYYQCENGTVVLKYCSMRFWYNKWFKKCVNYSQSHCQIYPTPKPEGTTLVPPATTIPPSVTENVCPFAGAKLPNPMNCSTYFVCIGNEPTLQNCPAGEGYSCWDQECESSAVAECIIDSKPGDVCSIDNLLLPKIDDCSSYYICQNGSTVSKKCPSGKEFNQWFGCVDTQYSHCHSSTTSSSTPTTTITQSTITPVPGNDVCPINGAKLPNPMDCNSYFICVNEQPEEQKCPNGQEYSCWDQQCEKPEEATCIREGTQEEKPCSKNGVQQQNVEDCSTYYKCVDNKITLEHCPNETLYSKWFGECMPYYLAHCTTGPTIKPPSTLVPPQTTIPPIQGSDICPFEGASLPNPLNCSTYFICLNNEPILANCPSGQGYSCWDQKCEDGAQDKCNPNTGIGQSCLVEGIKLPNTGDCDGYLECQNRTIEHQTCPTGTEFNRWFQKCVESELAHCISTTTTSPTTTKTTLTNPDTCPLDGAKLPNPLECDSYFTCINGEIVSQQCPAGETYSCWDQTCETPQHATCINEGDQQGKNCSTDDELLPNIANCNSYYKCVNGTVEMKFCAKGQFYLSWFKVCMKASAEICINYPTFTPPHITTPSVHYPTFPDLIYNVCPTEGALLPNPLDCTTYYECIKGTPTLENCPDGKIYSCWDQQCEDASTATCVLDGGQNGETCNITGLRSNDVTNCNRYYECDNGTITLKHCPEGQEFNVYFQGCYAKPYAHCHRYSTIEPGPTPTPATTSTPTANDTCPVDGAKLPNPLNCSAYFKCENGVPVPKLCADGLVYSCWEQDCLPAGEGHCISDGNQTGSSCSNTGQKIENPYDCHSYYQCIKGKVESKRCIFNWYYNKWFKICVPFSFLAHCTSNGSTIPPVTTPNPTPPPKSDRDICPIDGALLPNPLNCAEYYKCENEQPVPQTCPSGQEYSCWDQQCEAASSAQCIKNSVKPGLNCSKDGVRLQNSQSCTSYYECNNGIVQEKDCFTLTEYNKWYEKCLSIPYAHCEISVDVTTTTASPTFLPPNPTPSLDYDICPIEGALLPNPVDCTSYYICVNATPTIQKCRDGMEYSCWDQKCELDTDADCINEPQVGENCSVDKLRLRNVANCSSYYECENNKVVQKSCPPGKEFNDRFQDCYSPDRSYCVPSPTKPPVTGTVTPNTPISTPQIGNDICPEDGSLLPNPLNCSLYYKCINGTPTEQQCADGYLYSCWDQICEPPNVAQCIAETPPAVATCSNNGDRLPDPTDCKKYKECVNHVQETKSCPKNLYFNKWFAECVIKSLAHCNETTTVKPKPTKPTLPPSSKDDCPVDNAIIPDPTDCSSYYECKKGQPHRSKCPKGQKYCVWDQQCKETQSDAQCVNVGSPLGKNCSRDGVTIQNLESCNSFFQCMGGIVQIKYCFIGFKYNRWYQECKLSPVAHCDTYHTIAPSTTTTVASAVTTVQYPLASCKGNGKKIPKVTNCNQYFMCNKLTPILYNCPPKYNYDAWTQDCEPVANALCATNQENWVGKSCKKNGRTVPDANDCKKYYICKDKKIEGGSCSYFQYYSVWEGECTLSLFNKCANNVV